MTHRATASTPVSWLDIEEIVAMLRRQDDQLREILAMLRRQDDQLQGVQRGLSLRRLIGGR